MKAFEDNKTLTVAQREYYTGIAQQCAWHKPEMIDGGFIQIGSIRVPTANAYVTRFIEAHIETCGNQFRVLIYADTELVYTIRLIEELPHIFKPADDYATMVINGKHKSVRLGRWRSLFHFVDWYWEAVYATRQHSKRMRMASDNTVVVMS